MVCVRVLRLARSRLLQAVPVAFDGGGPARHVKGLNIN